MSAKMATNGIRIHARTNQRRTLESSRFFFQQLCSRLESQSDEMLNIKTRAAEAIVFSSASKVMLNFLRSVVTIKGGTFWHVIRVQIKIKQDESCSFLLAVLPLAVGNSAYR